MRPYRRTAPMSSTFPARWVSIPTQLLQGVTISSPVRWHAGTATRPPMPIGRAMIVGAATSGPFHHGIRLGTIRATIPGTTAIGTIPGTMTAGTMAGAFRGRGAGTIPIPTTIPGTIPATTITTVITVPTMAAAIQAGATVITIPAHVRRRLLPDAAPVEAARLTRVARLDVPALEQHEVRSALGRATRWAHRRPSIAAARPPVARSDAPAAVAAARLAAAHRRAAAVAAVRRRAHPAAAARLDAHRAAVPSEALREVAVPAVARSAVLQVEAVLAVARSDADRLS